MKKILITLACLFVTLLTFAQSPNLMNYQGVARNQVGNVIPNKSISLRLSILTGSPTGAVVYSETRTLLTNAFGLFNVVVGGPGATSTTGTIAGINWTAFGAGSGNKYLQVEIDPNGGANFTNVGSTQLVSVPYALNSGSAAPVGPAGGDLSGSYPNPTVVKLQGRNVSAAAPVNKNLLMWDGTTTSWIPATAAQAGIVSGTGTLNYVSKWTPDGVTLGNSQIFDDGTNVGVGTATPANKLTVVAGNNDGIAINSTGANFANATLNFNNTTTSPAVTNAANIALKSGAGDRSLQFYNSSAGLAATDIAYNFLNNAAVPIVSVLNGGNVGIGQAAPTGKLEVVNVGTNSSVIVNQSNAANAANTVLVDNANLTGTAFSNGSILARRGAVSGTTSMWTGAPSGIVGISSTGFAVQGASETSFGVAGTTVTGVGVRAYAVGTGSGLVSTAAGTGGISGDFAVTDATNISNTIRATNANATSGQTNSTNGGGNAIFGRKGTGLGTSITSPAGVYGTSSAANGIGVVGLTLTNIGNFGGTISTGTGVLGQTFGTGGIALFGAGASSPTSYGLVTQGLVQIQGNGAAVNKVLTSDATGNATWATLSASGGVSGTGTLNYMTKWSPDGSTIANSQLFDNGTSIGLGTVSPNARLDIPNASTTARGLLVNNTAAANVASTIYAQTSNVTGAASVEAAAITAVIAPFGAGTVVNTIIGPVSLKAFAAPANVTGAGGGTAIQGSTSGGIGVLGLANDGTALYGIATGTGYGLQTSGKVQIQGQGAALNRILSSDAAGNATWNSLATVGAVAGTGTLNYVPKWTPDGLTIGNSQIFDNGTNVGIGTTSPIAKLHTVGSSGLHAVLDGSSTVGTWLSMGNSGGGNWFNVISTGSSNGEGAGKLIFTRGAAAGTTSGNIMTFVHATKNVGINNVNPIATLDVAGTFKVTDGTQAAGKVLTSDAAGNASWQDLITPDVHMSAGSTTAFVSVPPNTSTNITTQWGNLDEGGGANYNPVTGEYTIPVAGYYSVFLHLVWNDPAPNSGAGLIYGEIKLNGSSLARAYSSTSIAGNIPDDDHAQVERRFNAGDIIRFSAYQNTTGTMNLVLNSNANKFGVHLIHK